MLNSNSIGNKIAAARKKINLSQSELAQQIFLSSQAVGKWERGESLPDITTLNRLAEILEVDLNYFSESFQSNTNTQSTEESKSPQLSDEVISKEKSIRTWDMSKLNLIDSDFSGLSNLHEKFGSTNMQRCLFKGSNLDNLQLSSNNIEHCDFTAADWSKSTLKNSNISHSSFNKGSLVATVFYKSNIASCDFTGADLTNASLRYSNFDKNKLEGVTFQNTSFLDMNIQEVVFEGRLDSCFFENCSFYGVKFQQATLLNTFFKNNRRMNKVEFNECKVDKITYAFLKSNKANLKGITIIND
jgi:uncharacterized protein YjbI with pentapeptide repeats